MRESIFFVFNDFCGRSNKYVAELYDEQIYAHLDHIIYGLGARKDVGCYIDVTGNDCVFPFKLTERNRMMIKVFNIYNYLSGNQIYDINSAIAEYYGDITLNKYAGDSGTSATASIGSASGTAYDHEIRIGGIGLVNSTYTLGLPTNSFSTIDYVATTSSTATNNDNTPFPRATPKEGFDLTKPKPIKTSGPAIRSMLENLNPERD